MIRGANYSGTQGNPAKAKSPDAKTHPGKLAR